MINLATVTDDDIKSILFMLQTKLKSTIASKGDKSFVSTHEGLGVLTEEYIELIDAIKSDNQKKIENEAYDVLISTIWLLASPLAAERERLEVKQGKRITKRLIVNPVIGQDAELWNQAYWPTNIDVPEGWRYW